VVGTHKGIKIGIVGRPNVGKSTLVNRMLGEDRVVVYDQPGTTRDSIYIPYERHGKNYTIIDTAGIRRRKNVKEVVEKFSIIKTLQAIQDANVVVLVLDAREGIVDQDLHLIGFVLDAGRALVIAVNKWDGMTQDDRDRVRQELGRRLNFLPDVEIKMISALHGTAVGDLYGCIHEAYDSAFAKWSTNKLTTILEDALTEHQPPLVHGRRIKLRYAHQGGSNPPVIVVHGNQTASLPNSYKRFLENTFRRVLRIKGTPIRFEFKTGENPFATKAKKTTVPPEHRKARLMKQIANSKKKPKPRRK
jgi:GTP-binding protein